MIRSPLSSTGWLLLAALVVSPLPADAGGVRFIEKEDAPPIQGTSIVVSPDGKHVYMAGLHDDEIAVSATNAAGEMTLVQTYSDANTADASSLAMSGDGRHLYVTSRTVGAGSLTVLTRNTVTGMLTPLETQTDGANMVPANTMRKPQGVVVAPAGPLPGTGDDYEHVYVVTQGDDSIVVFKRDNDSGSLDFGKLTYLQVLQQGPGTCDANLLCGLNDARTMSISPDGTSLYTGGKKGDAKAGIIAVFDRDADEGSGTYGQLTFVQTVRNLENGITQLHRPSALAVEPDGEQLYATAQGGSSVHVFAREDDTGSVDHGKLTVVEFHKDGSLTKGLKGASGLAIQPNGKYVYVTGLGDNAISVFRRDDATGKLTILETQFNEPDPLKPGFHVLLSPQDIAIAANEDKHLYIASQREAMVSFEIDYCGDTERGSDEQCDDGCDLGTMDVCEAADDNDGCSQTCRLETCATPATECTITNPAAAQMSQISIKNDPLGDGSKDQLQWKWSAGTIMPGGFGDPRDTTTYILCVYDNAMQPIIQASAPDGANNDCKTGDHCWKTSPGPSTSSPHIPTGSVKQFKYQDKSFTPDGLQQVQLKTGAGNASLKLKGKGLNLVLPVLPISLPITAIMKNTETEECWSATYSTFLTSDPTQFKAKN